jgi:hypothetical protein
MQYYSTFANQESIEATFVNMGETGAKLRDAAKEMCLTFNISMDHMANRAVMLVTPNGLDVGALFCVRNREGEDVFRFTSPALIHRERPPRGFRYGGRDLREGKTIKSLIQTIRKNDAKEITEQKVMAHWMAGLAGGLRRPNDNTRTVDINVSKNLLLPLVEAALGTDIYTVQQHKDALEQHYKDYLTRNKAALEAKENTLRFMRGCVAICEGNNKDRDNNLYITKMRAPTMPNGQYDITGYKFETMTPLVRIKELPEEYRGKEAIVRAYLEGKDELKRGRVFGIEAGNNEYVEDVDVVFEWSSLGQWTLIPDETFGEDDAPFFTT